RQLDSLRGRSRELEQQLQTAGRNNRRLTDLLELTRDEMEELKKALHADGQAPFTFGTVTSGLRMAFGGHFFTDVAIAGLVTFLVIWLLYALIYRWAWSRTSDEAIDA
ncbi:hypothetical protein, partial [Cereibacter sphaeroides]|uniref:hypothetical protein n=1 Tax=Cereibacter sphaeroides TaxID=1063 RepID=UPI001F2DBF93